LTTLSVSLNICNSSSLKTLEFRPEVVAAPVLGQNSNRPPSSVFVARTSRNENSFTEGSENYRASLVQHLARKPPGELANVVGRMPQRISRRRAPLFVAFSRGEYISVWGSQENLAIWLFLERLKRHMSGIFCFMHSNAQICTAPSVETGPNIRVLSVSHDRRLSYASGSTNSRRTKI